MKRRRLGKDTVDEIIKLLQEGKDAKDLASTYQVSVATIYNIRSRIKKDQAKSSAKKWGRKPKTEKAPIGTAGKMPITAQKLPATGKMENYSFTINGVDVTVSSEAKKIHIAPDVMVVSF